MNFKNILNKEADMLLNVFAIISIIWLLPVILVYYLTENLIMKPIKFFITTPAANNTISDIRIKIMVVTTLDNPRFFNHFFIKNKIQLTFIKLIKNNFNY